MGVMVPACNQLPRQEEHEFEGCLGYSEGPCLKRKVMRRKDRGAGKEGVSHPYTKVDME